MWENPALVSALCHSGIGEADMLCHAGPHRAQPYLTRWPKCGLIDTVGFVSRLPHNLVAAFKSTLEEAKYADLLLLVADAQDPDSAGCSASKMLAELGIDDKTHASLCAISATLCRASPRLTKPPLPPAQANKDLNGAAKRHGQSAKRPNALCLRAFAI